MIDSNIDNFSIIIRTKNEERWIGHVIQSIIDKIDKPQIIIIDNNSNDNTINIIKQFIEDPILLGKSKNYTNIKIINIDDYSPGKAINLGIQNCEYENILVISAHCVLMEFNYKKIVQSLKEYNAIFGKQIPIWEGKKISQRYIWSHFIDEKIINMFSKLENRYFFHNAASIYKKSFIQEHLFNENLTGKEDRYWASDIVSKGYSYLYDPSFVTHHHYTINGNTWKGLG